MSKQCGETRENKYGKSLQALRRQAGFKSAEAFASHIGMARSTYTNYEQGMRKLSLETACNLADVFGCSLDELAGRETPKHKPATETEYDSELVDFLLETRAYMQRFDLFLSEVLATNARRWIHEAQQTSCENTKEKGDPPGSNVA